MVVVDVVGVALAWESSGAFGLLMGPGALAIGSVDCDDGVGAVGFAGVDGSVVTGAAGFAGGG